MSGNRSVAAAQRRRAGGPEPAAPGTNRGPQPSINSSQMFSSQQQGQQQMQQQQQIRPGTSGRLAGQHAQLQQQQMQQQQTRDAPQSTGDAGVSKITIAQAITLITLRLGKAEMQLYELGHQVASTGGEQGFSSSIEGAENMVLIDKNLIDSIMSRLESLEKRAPTAVNAGSGSGSSAEVALLKQQFEAIKPSIAQNAKTTTALTKEQKEHKQQVDALKSELAETKELMNALQTLSMDNSTKIFALMSGEVNFDDGEGSDDLEGDELNGVGGGEDLESEELEIVGTDLKDLIEQELNA